MEQIVATELGVPVAQAQAELSNGTVWERRDKLEKAIDAIRSSGSVNVGSYGKIIIRNSPKFWHGTARTVRLFRK